MTYLRHASRAVHETVATYITEQLGVLGWTDPANVPFGAAVVKVQRVAAIEGDRMDNNIEPGTVAVTLGNEAPPVDQELGGPLAMQEYPIFVDVFQQRDGEAVALANDIKDIVLGRLPGTRRWLNVVDPATSVVVPGWKIELDDVERVRPEHTFPVHWHTVHVTANAYFQEVTF